VQKARGCCRVAAVQLIAHVQRALHDRLEPYPARGGNRLAYDGRHEFLDVEEPFSHAFVVDAVIQAPRIGSLIEVAVGQITLLGVPDHQYGHRRGVDSCKRSHTAKLAAGGDPDLATSDFLFGFLTAAGETFEERTTDHRATLTAFVTLPRHRRTRS
jgi:hypothetical protein